MENLNYKESQKIVEKLIKQVMKKTKPLAIHYPLNPKLFGVSVEKVLSKKSHTRRELVDILRNMKATRKDLPILDEISYTDINQANIDSLTELINLLEPERNLKQRKMMYRVKSCSKNALINTEEYFDTYEECYEYITEYVKREDMRVSNMIYEYNNFAAVRASNGGLFPIDKEDIQKIRDIKYKIQFNAGYYSFNDYSLVRTGERVYIHNYLMDKGSSKKDGLYVDHRYGCRIDNRKKYLDVVPSIVQYQNRYTNNKNTGIRKNVNGTFRISFTLDGKAYRRSFESKEECRKYRKRMITKECGKEYVISQSETSSDETMSEYKNFQ